MKKETKDLLKTISYLALIIFALLLAVERILPLVGISLQGVLLYVLDTIKNIFIIIVIGVNAYSFVEGKADWIKWLYWIAIIVIVVATVLMWIL